MKYKKNLRFLVRLLIGVGLLGALLLIDNNWRKVISLAQNIQIVYLAPFLGVSVVLVWVSCLKWRLFLTGRQVDLSVMRLMGLYLIGFFFNNFFPSNFGGDVVRSYILGRQIASQERALATVFLERFSGFLAMVSLAAGAIWFSPELRSETLVRWSVLVMGAGTVGVLVIIWRPKIIKWALSPFQGFEIVQTLQGKASQFHEHVAHFRGEPMLVARAMVYSYAFYAFAALGVYFAGLLLDIHCNLLQLFVVTPIVLLIAAIPLTPNSLGVWEWGFSVYLTSAGAAPEQGLAIALVLRAKNIVLSLVGGLLFLLEPDSYDPAGASEASATDDPTHALPKSAIGRKSTETNY